ncbi:unnamed protein product, partial [Rotaria sp. Silwood1]
MNTNNDETNE